MQAALLTLLDRKALDQITVREIAAEAGVHYATFFRHHPTKEALLDHIAADEIDRLVALTLPVLDEVSSEAAFAALFAYLDDQRALWTALLTGGAAGTMRDELLGISRTLALARAPGNASVPVELAVVCTVSMIIETMSWWLAQGPNGPPGARMAQILLGLVQALGMRTTSDQPPA